MNEGQVGGHITQWRYNVGEMFAALTVPFEFEGRSHPWAQAVLESLHVLAKIALFAMMPNERGLEIKRIQMACCTSHKELDDPLGLEWMMERAV